MFLMNCVHMDVNVCLGESAWSYNCVLFACVSMQVRKGVIVSRSSLTSEVITAAQRFIPIRKEKNQRQAKNKTDK